MVDEGGALTGLQMRVLGVVRECDGATVQDVHERLAAERGLARSTVATLMSRLQARGLLERGSERPFVYRVTRTEAELQRDGIRDLAERAFGGDLSAMLCQLLRDGASSPEELQQMRELIAQRERELEEEN